MLGLVGVCDVDVLARFFKFSSKQDKTFLKFVSKRFGEEDLRELYPVPSGPNQQAWTWARTCRWRRAPLRRWWSSCQSSTHRKSSLPKVRRLAAYWNACIGGRPGRVGEAEPRRVEAVIDDYDSGKRMFSPTFAISVRRQRRRWRRRQRRQ